MQIFDPSYKQKLISLGYACPEYPTHVCQIAGDYVAQFPDWNTIQPYAGTKIRTEFSEYKCRNV